MTLTLTCLTLTLTCPPPVQNFITQMISKNFLPIINRPTRVKPNSCTLIDYIFCNRVDEVESSGVLTRNIFDHYPVFSREKFPTIHEDSISINYRVFSDENLSTLKIYYKILTGTQY